MTAGVYNIKIEQGAVFVLDLNYKTPQGDPIDLTGYTARMQVRHKYSAGDPPLLNLTTENGGILVDGVLGTITVKAKAELTAALTIKQGVYDLEIIPPSGEDDVIRLLEGAVSVSPEVTR